MHVVITIVGFRNPEDIVGCLKALAQSIYADFEVVICENGGADAFTDLVGRIGSALPGGQPVDAFDGGGNLGFAGGVNACIAARLEADAWWILNPDTCPEPEALQALVDKLTDGSCDAVGCVLRLPNGTNQAYGGRWTPWLARARSIGWGTPWDAPVNCGNIEREQNYLLGASLLASRRFVEVAGLMREDYFLYSEEAEWCLRARGLGLRLGFAQGAIVMHDSGATTGSATWSRLSVYLNERNRVLLTRDRFPQFMPSVIVASALILVARCVQRRAWRQIGYGLGGWVDGLKNRRGPPQWLQL